MRSTRCPFKVFVGCIVCHVDRPDCGFMWVSYGLGHGLPMPLWDSVGRIHGHQIPV